MPRIDTDTKLDFKDVLIRPKRSTLKSRSEVDLDRTFIFKHSNYTWTGVPVMAANMFVLYSNDFMFVLILFCYQCSTHAFDCWSGILWGPLRLRKSLRKIIWSPACTSITQLMNGWHGQKPILRLFLMLLSAQVESATSIYRISFCFMPLVIAQHAKPLYAHQRLTPGLNVCVYVL